MNLIEQYYKELTYLKQFDKSSIMISTTAKHALEFSLLPRRSLPGIGISCFMINDQDKLKETLSFFDGKVDNIFIDVEQKQSLNIFEAARNIIRNSKLITVKPNDITVESCDLLIRNHFNDNLYNKNIVVLGTGNLASKTAVRLAERQANVYIAGRSSEKENKLVEALNLFLPRNTSVIQSIEETSKILEVDMIVSFLSGQFMREEILLPLINQQTFIIDGGINNFSSTFIQRMLDNNIQITRLDTRIALPYQLLSGQDYTNNFFNDVFGQSEIEGTLVVSGGYIGRQGAVIVDNIKEPNQVIGIADGSGGVKSNEQLRESDKSRIQKVEQFISATN